jgi:hypothetical protein
LGYYPVLKTIKLYAHHLLEPTGKRGTTYEGTASYLHGEKVSDWFFKQMILRDYPFPIVNVFCRRYQRQGDARNGLSPTDMAAVLLDLAFVGKWLRIVLASLT